MLAKVSLWTGDWNTTISASNEILSKYPTLMSQAMYGATNKGTQATPEMRPEQNGFLNISINPEVLFGFALGEAVTVHNWWMNCFAEGNGGIGQGFQRIDNRLYAQIDNRDYRVNCFMASDWGIILIQQMAIKGQYLCIRISNLLLPTVWAVMTKRMSAV
ncbi:hypothetical protein KUH03_22880 [Sphingobacterium sp. E70]|uniref:hypothetical protein n=1 Tax=Sphingobacterium sp. E70 TaxID=2853439 RepID=UPI00211C3111|nr:hypothetical protein [Sphingobacterium sp. E70]ULT22291.1 hypothetical protein KUH03_22880 [Sphingobacterium sp. E70]